MPTIPVSVHKYLNTIINNGTTTKLISNLNITNYKCNRSQLVEKANKIREGPKNSTLRQNNVVRSTSQMMFLRRKSAKQNVRFSSGEYFPSLIKLDHEIKVTTEHKWTISFICCNYSDVFYEPYEFSNYDSVFQYNYSPRSIW